ncbi:alkaline phosphatase family protein [Algoriphagus pacificus]|uniref:Phospholipase C n=1 Tax=Algoriphagus pacificus TaxID=2811234 RepID=A0ABS3CLL8_9BACT|nr:alkaline phosphatase family protein [Algoriphagus pacificus]MBN7817439.1 hypothetical protein [Algoriphagus pacificus]
MSTILITRNKSDDGYGAWTFTPDSKNIFTKLPISPTAKFDSTHQLAPIGGYLLDWGPADSKNSFPYRLISFDESSSDPLAGETIQNGHWPITKFWGYRPRYSDNPDEKKTLPLISMGNFMLFFVGGKGRGTYMLYNFDPNLTAPNTSDPIPSTYTPQGGFPTILEGNELINIGNYVLDRHAATNTYRIWSFDPQSTMPLSIPEVKSGTFEGIEAKHQIVVVGEQILTWVPGELKFSLWAFDPAAKHPFRNLICDGDLPSDFSGVGSILGIQTLEKVNVGASTEPGTIDFMRTKIKRVVYYMLESRSFDNVCGWLYENNQSSINFIGSDRPFDGASTENYNLQEGKKVYASKFKDGKLSEDYDLSDQGQDPFHDNSDGLQQMFYETHPGYKGHATPDMGGFVRNNSNTDVMLSLTPEQLPVLNGLAENFAISDEWFCSVPGGTDINRAFSVTGSGMNRLDTWEGGSIYEYWPNFPHRQSLWKVLYNNGFKDWKIYNVIDWLGYPFTYHLYLQGQVPSIDAKPAPYINSLETFKLQARQGILPTFSFLEPIWIAPIGTTSYHPGGDMVPAELALRDIYNAIKDGPQWEETLFVITFSKNGGIYDHVKPPYAAKPWPNDNVDGFKFDLMGPRVPTIFVSPWIKKNTVIRSGQDIPFDSTSFAATLLKWYGIPKARWGMGDRMDQAPTFESVFQETSARTDDPKITVPYDKSFPRHRKEIE